MPSAVSPNPRAGSGQPDELDRLLEDDDAVEDFFRDLPGEVQNNSTARNEQARDEDQEVLVKKKRVPIPKLDENRLLSQAGIPKLRKITKSRLKFRGKGHEYTDISNLLNTYQLWLDDLYPRAKFRDAITMVEKVGHSKRMQVTRRAWLDDTKPNRKELTPPPDLDMSNTNGHDQEDLVPDSAAGTGNTQGDADGTAPGDDELDALMVEDIAGAAPTKANANSHGTEPDEDELDALLGDGEVVQNATVRARKLPLPFEESDDDDELEALMAMQTSQQPDKPTAQRQVDHDFADDEEAMREMW